MISVGSQSLQDKLNALRCIVSGQGLSFVVLKATTSELLGPKKKHLAYLTNVTNEPNVSIPNLVKHLMQRARNQEWTVVFKSLMTIHYLMSYGNEKFIQNLASSTINQKYLEQISSYSDKSSNRAYDMSTFIRRYSRYIAAKVGTYKSSGLDFCRPTQHNDTSARSSRRTIESLIISSAEELPPTLMMKSMTQDRLLATLPQLQNLFDLLMAFDAGVKDLNNGIINSAFSMLYKDFVKLYITYQTAIIRLLELYFACKLAKQAHEMLDAYKKFLIRMDKVSDFMFVVDAVGMDKSDMPNVSRSPNLSLKLMEKHLELLTSSSQSTLKRHQFASSSKGTLPRGLSVELLPRIDYDYGSYSSRRRRSLRRSTTSSPAKPPLQLANNRYDFTDEALKEEEPADVRSSNEEPKTCVIESAKLDNVEENNSLLPIQPHQEQNADESDRKSLLLMGDSEDLKEDSEVRAAQRMAEEEKKGGGGLIVGNLPSDWIRVDF